MKQEKGMRLFFLGGDTNNGLGWVRQDNKLSIFLDITLFIDYQYRGYFLAKGGFACPSGTAPLFVDPIDTSSFLNGISLHDGQW